MEKMNCFALEIYSWEAYISSYFVNLYLSHYSLCLESLFFEFDLLIQLRNGYWGGGFFLYTMQLSWVALSDYEQHLVY